MSGGHASEPEDLPPPVMVPVSDRVLQVIAANRRSRTAIRVRSLDPSLTPIERAQVLQAEVLESSRTPGKRDAEERQVFYRDPETGVPVSWVPAATALLLDRAAVIREALEAPGMTQRRVAAHLGIRQPTLVEILHRADEAQARLHGSPTPTDPTKEEQA